MTTDKLTYCGELVHTHDPDRFLVSLKMRPEMRRPLWSLYAFNYEISKTREVVTETTIGLIRLQWWRDAIAALYEGQSVSENEILPDLSKAITEYDLPREHFDKLIYAREFDLEDAVPANMEGMMNYADYTNVPLLHLGLAVTGETADEDSIRDIAIAYGLTGLLRSVAFHASQNRCYLPADMLAKHGISERSLYEMKPDAALSKVIENVADEALKRSNAKVSARSLNAHRKLCRLYLKQIRNLGCNVFSSRMQQPPAFFHLRYVFDLL